MGSRLGFTLAVCALALALLGGAAAPSPSRSSVLAPPSFRASPAWWTISTGPSSRVELAPQVWAITAYRGSNVGALVPFDLFNGLRRLSRGAVLVWALTAGRGGPNGTFTRATWPLRLSSFRVDRMWEGQPTLNVQQRLRWASVRGWRLDVRVYFATQRPGKRPLRIAQAEIDRMLLPNGSHS
jgi:hypothetical protein